MRKSTFILSLAAMSSLSVMAQDAPVAKWAALMGGNSGDQSTAVTISPQSDVLWLSTVGSTEAAPEVYYNGEVIFNGALYNAGNSANNNLALLCTSPDGALKWVISSTSGDYLSGQGNIAVDAEGDIVFSAKVRHTDGMLDQELNLVDAGGDVYSYGGTTEKRYYRLIVVKADSEGHIKWVKSIDASTDPAPCASGNNAEFTPDAISSTALAVDGSGNIYVGGNYSSAITIDDVTLQPVNVSSWNGDSQTASGNMFLIKLDAEGKYVDSAVGVGDIAGVSAVQSLCFDGSGLYVYGYAKGAAPFSFAGVKLTPTDVACPVVGCLDTDLKAYWIKCLPSEPVEDKSALQNVGISVSGDALWLSGMFNQKIADSSDTGKYVAATQGKLREGFIIKLDKNDGSWLGSADSRVDYPEITKLTGYLQTVQNPEDMATVYVYGYVMDATVGVFMRAYDAATLQPIADKAWSVATGGGVPTAVACAYDAKDNSAYITARGNKAFTLQGEAEITTEAPKNWDVLMARIAMPVKDLSGVSSINVDTDSSAVYDLMGRRMAETDRLQPGIYIRGAKKFIVR